MDVYVEVKPDLSEKLSSSSREEIGREAAHHIKSLIGVSAQVHVVETDKIERTLVGKARRVIDRRPK
jgi:phenylacetate-CoA ligase